MTVETLFQQKHGQEPVSVQAMDSLAPIVRCTWSHLPGMLPELRGFVRGVETHLPAGKLLAMVDWKPVYKSEVF